jgi:PleD family two-component response regulator
VFSNNFNRGEEIGLIDKENTAVEQVEIGLNATEKPTILVVEDNADVRIYIKTLLKNDFEIIEAVNGQEGFLKAMKLVPELIISDVMMDLMDGFELCKNIKENISTSHIPMMLIYVSLLIL